PTMPITVRKRSWRCKGDSVCGGITLFHDPGGSLCNCGARVISAFATVRLKPDTTYAGGATVRLTPDTTCVLSTMPASSIPRVHICCPVLPAIPPGLPLFAHALLEAEQPRRIPPANVLALVVGDRQRVD